MQGQTRSQTATCALLRAHCPKPSHQAACRSRDLPEQSWGRPASLSAWGREPGGAGPCRRGGGSSGPPASEVREGHPLCSGPVLSGQPPSTCGPGSRKKPRGPGASLHTPSAGRDTEGGVGVAPRRQRWELLGVTPCCWGVLLLLPSSAPVAVCRQGRQASPTRPPARHSSPGPRNARGPASCGSTFPKRADPVSPQRQTADRWRPGAGRRAEGGGRGRGASHGFVPVRLFWGGCRGTKPFRN